MFWYFLYPFRGTTEPPQLPASHPIRKSFIQFGTHTARHWLGTIVVSISVAVLLCYPAFLLYENPSPGSLSLPHHVWTSATVFEGSSSTRADVEMRQVWVHGNYMKALNKRVIQEAQEIQDALLGAGFGQTSGSTTSSIALETNAYNDMEEADEDLCSHLTGTITLWGFHSPLMFWNCSHSTISADQDILSTVNSQSQRASFLNMTLRPTSVFAGKSFNRSRLIAADALVITLFDRMGFGIGEEWNARAVMLAKSSRDKWSIYPESGRATRSQLYEFRFEPMSMYGDFILSIAYLAMALYVITALRKLRAIRSQFGLLLTVIAQIGVSIFASFTICATFRINLSRMPRELYPFVTLVLGLENMFRLINAVLAKPASFSTTTRIASALGDVGHLALAHVAQNLIALYLLSYISFPGVDAFCIFAAIALIVDFFFHLTYFVAILSVEVRRTELQDSIHRAQLNDPMPPTSRLDRQTWTSAFRSGKLPVSSRVAGTAIQICFILALNWHFLDYNDRNLFGLQKLALRGRASRRARGREPLTAPPINQARTPSAWLRMQDHDTAKEVIQFVKPQAHSFVARVYEPITIVLKDSDREGMVDEPGRLTTVLLLLQKHFLPIGVVLISVVAVVTLLMSYLLWDELPEDDNESEYGEELPLSISHLPLLHKLDVVFISASDAGHVLSVGIDRSKILWIPTASSNDYTAVELKEPYTMNSLWPICATAIDSDGILVALLTNDGRLGLFDVQLREFSGVLDVTPHDQTLLVFSVVSRRAKNYVKVSVIILDTAGFFQEIDCDTGGSTTLQIGQKLQAANLGRGINGTDSIFAVTSSGQIVEITPNETKGWSSGILHENSNSISTNHAKETSYVFFVASLNILTIVGKSDIKLVDTFSERCLLEIKTTSVVRNSVRVFHTLKKPCECGSIAVRSLSVAFTKNTSRPTDDANDLVVQTFVGDGEISSQVCLRSSTNGYPCTNTPLERAKSSRHTVESCGMWDSTRASSIIGVRSFEATPAKSPASILSFASRGNIATSILDSRKGPAARRNPSTPRLGSKSKLSLSSSWRSTAAATDLDSLPMWEAYMLSATGDFFACPIAPPYAAAEHADEATPLLAASVGPLRPLGKRGVVLGLANAVNVVSVGHDWRGEPENDGGNGAGSATAPTVARRRRAVERKTQ